MGGSPQFRVEWQRGPRGTSFAACVWVQDHFLRMPCDLLGQTQDAPREQSSHPLCVFNQAGQPGWQRSILIPQQRSLGSKSNSHPHPHVSLRFGCQPDWRCPRNKSVDLTSSLSPTIVLLLAHLVERSNPSSRFERS